MRVTIHLKSGNTLQGVMNPNPDFAHYVKLNGTGDSANYLIPWGSIDYVLVLPEYPGQDE